MSIYYDQNEIPGIAQDIVDQEYGGNWGEIKQDLESGDIYRADEKLVYTIQDYMSSHLDTEDEDDEDILTEELLAHMENKAKTSHRANRKRVKANVRWESSGMGYVSENYTVHNAGGEVYGEPDQWVILENDYDVPEISGVFDTAEDAMNAVEQKTSHRANLGEEEGLDRIGGRSPGPHVPKRKLVNEDSQVIVDYLLERHDEWDLNQYIQDSRNDNYGVGRDLAQLSVDNPNSDFYTLLLKTLGKSSHRANHKRANDLFDRLFSSPGVFSVGSSGDIMAYVDLPSDEIPSGGTHFYWVVIDSNGDEIVGGSTSSFEEAKSLAENNLFRLSRELYPESYTSHKANRKTSSDITNELWFDRDTGDVYEIWIDGNYVVGYNLTFEGGPFTVSEVAGEGVFSPSDFRLQRDGVVSKNDIITWGLVPIDTLEKGQAIEIIERNGYPMPASLGHARDSHRANHKVAEYDPTNVFQNEGVWEIAEMVWDSRLLSYDVSDEVIEEKIRDYSETFLGEVADTHFVDSVMNILKENLKHSNHKANLKVSYSKEDEFEVHDEVVEKFPGGEGALADLFGYTNQDQAEINSAKVMPYIEDAVFSRGGDQDDVEFAYDNLEYHFQTEY